MIKTWASIPKGKNGQVKYIEKANFSLEILKHITPSHEADSCVKFTALYVKS